MASVNPNKVVMNDQKPNDFEQANQQEQAGLAKKFFAFLGENKKFWLIPLLLALLAIGVLLIVDSTSEAPFSYTLF